MARAVASDRWRFPRIAYAPCPYRKLIRVQALKIYNRLNQANAIDLVDYVIKKFPFRIQMIRTDRGHEFQAKFHWHVEELGVCHVYIKARLSLPKTSFGLTGAA